jgi:SAM-dependent methyltransferase
VAGLDTQVMTKRIVPMKGIISKLINIYKFPLSRLGHLLDSEARKLDRARIAAMYLQGEGIEIGALNAPLEVSPDVLVRYVDRMPEDSLRQQYPWFDDMPLVRVDIVDDFHKLLSIADASQDFVIANGVLEHLENPLLAMKNMLRVVKEGGIIYICVPDKRYTFDRDRPVTPLKHLFRDYDGQPDRPREVDFEEYACLVEKIKGDEEVKRRTKELMETDYSIHFHVWTQTEILEFLVAVKRWMKLPFNVELIYCIGSEVIVILKKSDVETPQYGHMSFWIDSVQEVIKDEKAFTEIAGWAFLEGQNSENSEIHVILESDSNTYVFDTELNKRPDVTTFFKTLNLNLDDSGFFVRIPKEAVERATYRVSICVKKGYIEALRCSDIKIDFRP